LLSARNGVQTGFDHGFTSKSDQKHVLIKAVTSKRGEECGAKGGALDVNVANLCKGAKKEEAQGKRGSLDTFVGLPLNLLLGKAHRCCAKTHPALQSQ
jgi:hypothetical protein